MIAKADINMVCVPDRDQSGSILHMSSSFTSVSSTIFNTVSNSDIAEAGHTRARDTCSYRSIRTCRVLC